jgi:hypothetical protein
MSDFPAPTSYINDENENNNPSIIEEQQYINNYNDYAENIEATKDDNNNNTYPKPNFSNRITFKSESICSPLIFVFSGLGFGIGFTFLCLKDDNIGAAIGVNVFTLVGIGSLFALKCCSYMTIDINLGVIYVKNCKIYSCKKRTYNIDDISEIDMRESNISALKKESEHWVYYDIVLVLNDGRNIIGATRSGKDDDANKVCNTLRNILPQRIQILNILPQQLNSLNNQY